MKTNFVVGFGARVRAPLMGSAALLSLAIGGVAHAADVAGPPADPSVLQGGANGKVDVGGALLEAQDTSVKLDPVAPDPQILIANPGTPTTARDPVNITGIAQMVIDNGGGSVGLCTASLINPRTVLFAAHCVNSRAATAYGANSGGVAIGFGFETNTRANAAGQVDELVAWLFGGGGGPGQYRTNIAQAFYNADYVVYNPLSLQPNANGFLYGDIALATLDTPAANIPTWALLFSPLPAPGTIGAAGTGYHVTLNGYGNNGTGTSGAASIDFRRRAAENMLGGLLSLGDFEQFLFGPTGTTNTTNPQNLYWIDFDDPRRGTASASPFDFNAFRDNALPNEGITSGGDSGGPLILDRTYARQVVIGVLSGGYTRFFNGQPANGYGTAAFYQPLYLYWDYIAANNPYRYVGSLAGDANWTDPTHWVTNNDPNYFIIGANNTLVNGVPANPGGTVIDTSGKFGQICFQTTTLSDCLDVRTGVETVNGNPIGTAGNGLATVKIDGLTSDIGTGFLTDTDPVQTAAVVGQEPVATADGVQTSNALPPATIANGLPGATNFVPNNTAGVRATGVLPRYFDVTLAASGTTTLNTAVTIDRLTLNGLNARLDITSAGSLTSLINVTQTLGTLQVNGSLTSVGDFLFMTGGINGTGTITAPFFTSILGVISPGASGSAGSVGTLTFRGNVILSSGNTYRVDLGANGTSDRIAVNATSFNGTTPLNGLANLGGNLALSYSASTLRAGNVYTILTSQGGVSGTFQAPTAISAILTPQLIYSANQVQLGFTVGNYRNVVTSNLIQGNYAALFDQNRGPTNFDNLYGPLDLQNAATIQATFDGLAPRTQTLNNALGVTAVDNMARFYRDRLETLGNGEQGGTVAVIGKPIELAALNASGAVLGTAGRVENDGGQAMVQEGKLPDDMSAYLAGGYVDGDSAPMPGTIPGGGRDQFNGYYIAGGLEKDFGGGTALGFSLSYSDIKGQTTVVGQSASGQLYQGTLYGKVGIGSGVSVDGQVNVGVYDASTVRNVSFVGTPYALREHNGAFVVGSEIGIQKSYDIGFAKVTPRAAIRNTVLDFGASSETGGGPALRYSRNSYNGLEGRAGLALSTDTGGFRPFVNAYYVHDFLDQPNFVGANFVNGIGPNQYFALAGDDNDWGEVTGGLTYDTGKVAISLYADTTVARGDVSNQSYRGSISFKF